MKIFAKVGLVFYDEEANKEDKKMYIHMKNKIRKFKCGNLGTVIGDIYKLETTSQIFNEILEFGSNSEKFLDLYIEYHTKYTEAELEQAIAFVVQPIKSYMYGKDVFIYSCNKCDKSNLADGPINVGKVSNGSFEQDIFQLGEGIETIDCISPQLYNIINVNDEYSDSFIMINSGKKMLGYAFNPIEKTTLISNIYDYMQCEKCGSSIAVIKEECRNEYEQYSIDKKKIVRDIVKSSEYYDGQQKNIISKKLFRILSQYVNTDNFIPILNAVAD